METESEERREQLSIESEEGERDVEFCSCGNELKFDDYLNENICENCR